MGRAVCIIGFERRDKCPHGRGKEIGKDGQKRVEVRKRWGRRESGWL